MLKISLARWVFRLRAHGVENSVENLGSSSRGSDSQNVNSSPRCSVLGGALLWALPPRAAGLRRLCFAAVSRAWAAGRLRSALPRGSWSPQPQPTERWATLVVSPGLILYESSGSCSSAYPCSSDHSEGKRLKDSSVKSTLTYSDVHIWKLQLIHLQSKDQKIFLLIFLKIKTRSSKRIQRGEVSCRQHFASTQKSLICTVPARWTAAVREFHPHLSALLSVFFVEHFSICGAVSYKAFWRWPTICNPSPQLLLLQAQGDNRQSKQQGL